MHATVEPHLPCSLPDERATEAAQPSSHEGSLHLCDLSDGDIHSDGSNSL